MSTTITGVPINTGALLPSTATAPIDGEMVTGASVQEGVQGAMNVAASLASGNYETGATVLHTGPETFENLIIDSGDKIEVRTQGTMQLDVGATTVINADVNLGVDTIGDITITGATNATPIVCTLAGAPVVPLADGDVLTIAGALGNTAANGDWPIKVTSTTVFSLVNSVGNGAYTASSATAKKRAQVKRSTATSETRSLHAVMFDAPVDGTFTGGSVGWSSAFVTGYAPGAMMDLRSDATDGTRPLHIQWDITPSDCPTGGKLLTVAVLTLPPSGHSTSFPPSVLPKVEVFRVPNGLQAQPIGTSLGSVQNTNSPAAAYELYAILTVALGTAEILDHSRFRYVVVFTPEAGTNALPQTIVYGAVITTSIHAAADQS